MEQHIHQLLVSINCAVIQWRGAYAAWARENQMNYHELLVLYSLRDYPECTQKMICQQYLLPKQTVNNVIRELQRKGYAVLRPGRENWREKVIALTEAGQAYSDGFMKRLERVEEEAVRSIGAEQLQDMAELVLRFGQTLKEEFDIETAEHGKH